MHCLGVGVAVDPAGLELLRLDALTNKVLLQRLTKIVAVISLLIHTHDFLAVLPDCHCIVSMKVRRMHRSRKPRHRISTLD